MIKLSTKIGRFQIQVELKEMKDLHKFGAVYGNLPKKCDACESDNIYLSHKSPKGSDYYMIACGDCQATANFGIHKNDSQSLYWKREKMEVFQGNMDAINNAAHTNIKVAKANIEAAKETFGGTAISEQAPNELPF